MRRAFADGNVDRLREIVAEFVKAKVDVIVTTSLPRRRWRAKMATSTIPIVMTLAPDPVEPGRRAWRDLEATSTGPHRA